MKIEPVNGGQNFELTLDGDITPDYLMLRESLGQYTDTCTTPESPIANLLTDITRSHIGPFVLTKAGLVDLKLALEDYIISYRQGSRGINRGRRLMCRDEAVTEHFQRHNLAVTAWRGLRAMVDDIESTGSSFRTIEATTQAPEDRYIHADLNFLVC